MARAGLEPARDALAVVCCGHEVPSLGGHDLRDRAALLVAVFDEVVATVTAAAFAASDAAPPELEQRTPERD